MANLRQAKKRVKQAEKHRRHNASRRSEMRTYIKQVLKAVTAKDKSVAEELFKKCSSTLDRLASVGIIHKNRAAKQKSRLAQKIKSLG